MLEARTIGISIARNWSALYEDIWRPEFFPEWASGLGGSSLVPAAGSWRREGSDGQIRIRFTPHNVFGVMDHYVDLGIGPEIYVPLRVIANGDGSEVLLTLFRQPGMSDEKFAADAEWVARDLAALKALVGR